MSTGEKSATTSFEEKDGGKLLSSVPLKYEDTLLTIQHVATPYEGDAQDATSLAGSALREPTISRSLVHFCKESWLNLLFVFVPISWALHYSELQLEAEFTTALLAIIPLARTLGYISEQVALRCSPGVGMMIIITMGNVIEFIIACILLVSCDIEVVQSSLVGAILSNLLLVLGGCLFSGGIRYSQQGFASVAAKLSSSILMVSVIAILIPAGFDAALTVSTTYNEEARLIKEMSRIIAIMLIITYGAYLVFQLLTHTHLYHSTQTEEDAPAPGSDELPSAPTPSRISKFIQRVAERPDGRSAGMREDMMVHEAERPEINLVVSIVIGVISMGLLCMSAIFFIGLIDSMAEAHPTLKKSWIGLILIPMISNGSEQLSSLGAAAKDKIDFALAVAIGKSVQLALFVIPLLILIGWGINISLTLLFNPFISIVLFLAVLITTYTIQGKSTWFDGWLLLISWIIIAVAFWYYPVDGESEISKVLACYVEGPISNSTTTELTNATIEAVTKVMRRF